MLECQSVKEQHQDSICAKNGVVGIGVGSKWENGVPLENVPAILIFVEKKRSKRGLLTKFSVDDLIPETIDGVRTDVIEVGKLVKHAAGFRERMRPIKPGYSCGHKNVTAGTIGGVFLDKDNDPVILSNCHVLAWENKAKLGDIIYQPGIYDTNRKNLDFREWPDPVGSLPYIGTLKQFVALSEKNNRTDSAIARIHPKIVESGLIDTLYPMINQNCNGFGVTHVGQQVQKCGRTTGYTTGRVIGMNATFTIGYDFGPATFEDCIVFTSLSSGGDSGSIIMDMNANAVAHLFAGSNKVTIGNPISYAQNEYGLKLWNAKTVTPTLGFNNSEWKQHTTSGTIQIANNVATINAPANQFCFLEDDIGAFNSVSVDVNTGTDKGATWGPGLTIQWPNGIMKVNVRHNDKFGGYFNGTFNINIGAVKANANYTLRIRKSTTGTFIGEVLDSGKWYTVIEIPISIFPQAPIAVRVGKTDLVGQPSNHTDAGSTGTCTVSNFVRD